MKWLEFSDPKRFFVIVCFVHESEFEQHREHLEALGKQRNVKLLVQPCPFEGIEFLFRIDQDLMGHISSFDEELFWKALEIKPETPKPVIEDIADHYHSYFCAILEQDGDKVKKAVLELGHFNSHFEDNL